jgi:hypothetical protein
MKFIAILTRKPFVQSGFRAILGSLCGYFLSNSMVSCMIVLLPFPRAEAVVVSILFGFFVLVAAIIIIFTIKTTLRASFLFLGITALAFWVQFWLKAYQ